MPRRRKGRFGRGVYYASPVDAIPQFTATDSRHVRHYNRRISAMGDCPIIDSPTDALQILGQPKTIVNFGQGSGGTPLMITTDAIYQWDDSTDQFHNKEVLNPKNGGSIIYGDNPSDTVDKSHGTDDEVRFDNADNNNVAGESDDIVRITSAGPGGPWRGRVKSVDGNNGITDVTVANAAVVANIQDEFDDNNLTLQAYTPLTGGNGDLIDYTTFNQSGTQYLIITNGVDTPWEWDGSGQFSVMSLTVEGVTDFAARFVESLSNILLFGYTVEDGTVKETTVRYSTINSRTDFTNDGSTDSAGSTDLALEGMKEIRSLATVGGDLVVFDRDKALIGRYIGATSSNAFTFAWETAFTGTGLLYRRGWTDVGEGILFIGPDKIYFFDGGRPRPVDTPIRPRFYKDLHYSDNVDTQVIHEPVLDEVWFVVKGADDTSGSGASRAWVLNWKGTLDDPQGRFTQPVWYPTKLPSITALGRIDIGGVTTWSDLDTLATDNAPSGDKVGRWKYLPFGGNVSLAQLYERRPFVPVCADENGDVHMVEGGQLDESDAGFDRGTSEGGRWVQGPAEDFGRRDRVKWVKQFIIDSKNADVTYDIGVRRREQTDTDQEELADSYPVPPHTRGLSGRYEVDVSGMEFLPRIYINNFNGEVWDYEWEWHDAGEY